VITRRHFVTHRAGHPSAPPPLHVIPLNPDAAWYPLPRPPIRFAQPGPPLILGGPAYPSLGIDPTDRTTWGGRGYRQCAGMVGRFNDPDDWRQPQ
jgi:hypothetical protein